MSMTSKEISAFIEKYGLSTSLLSAKIGVSKGTFSNKKNGKNYSKFTPEQVKILTKEIEGMCKEWGRVCSK